MEDTLNNEVIIERQFDFFCKTVSRNATRNISVQERNWNKKHVSIEDLSDVQLNNWFCHDSYATDFTEFNAHGYKVAISDDLLAEAVAKLPKRQHEIILLSYFVKKDKEIAELLGLSPSTVHEHKTNALLALRKIMEAKVDETE